MYGKLDDKMNRDDGVPLADPAWRKVEREKEILRTTHRAERIWARLEGLKIAAVSASDTAPLGAVFDLADQYADFILGDDEAGANDILMKKLSTIADVCRNAGV